LCSDDPYLRLREIAGSGQFSFSFENPFSPNHLDVLAIVLAGRSQLSRDASLNQGNAPPTYPSFWSHRLFPLFNIPPLSSPPPLCTPTAIFFFWFDASPCKEQISIFGASRSSIQGRPLSADAELFYNCFGCPP